MLIQYKLSLKTTLILLLFLRFGAFVSNGNPLQKWLIINASYEINDSLSTDTLNTVQTSERKEINPISELNIPLKLLNENIDFQINSEISYYNIRNFIKTQSKKKFLQAWLNEREVKRISVQTDSLRKVYINSLNDRKADISAQILIAEERLISLNIEIPELYEQARSEEKLYWLTASQDEKVSFLKKTDQIKDSINQVAELNLNPTSLFEPKVPDTISFYKTSASPEIKPKLNSEITYKILIGTYKGKIPDSASKAIKKLSLLRKVDEGKDEKGYKIFTTGNLKNIEEAAIMQNQVKQEGIKNAVIAAYQHGKRITLPDNKSNIH